MRTVPRPHIFRRFSALVTGAALLATSGCRLHRTPSWERAPLPPGVVETVGLKAGPGLDVDRVRFHSRELAEPRFFLVLKPHGTKPSDVWILNHGWADRPEILIEEMHLEATYLRLLAQGLVRPAVIVVPDVRFSDFYRVNAGKFPFPQYLVLIAEEVAGLVAERYGVPLGREHWGIGGFSFGGYLSLDVGRRYAGRFSSVSVVSGFYDSDWSYWPATPPTPGSLDEKGRGKQTVVLPGPPPRLMLACGRQDRFYSQMVQLHDTFDRFDIRHQWLEAPGGHTWEYWRSVLDAMFVFHLAGSATPTAPPGGASR
jgi:enterochelin esterase-like enzyme